MKTFQDGSILVGPARFSYLTVFKPRQNQQGKSEYSVTLLFPKDPTGTHCPHSASEVKEIMAALKAKAQSDLGERAKGCKICLKDGDAPGDDGEPKAPGYWFLRCSAGEDYAPMLIDGQKNVVTKGWKSGDWGYVKLRLWTYNRPDARGVSAGLLGIQFLYQDDPLGGGSSASPDDFEVVADAHAASYSEPADDYNPFQDE